jgi:hypothetical protein
VLFLEAEFRKVAEFRSVAEINVTPGKNGGK